jgi:hypothetical protein
VFFFQFFPRAIHFVIDSFDYFRVNKDGPPTLAKNREKQKT